MLCDVYYAQLALWHYIAQCPHFHHGTAPTLSTWDNKIPRCSQFSLLLYLNSKVLCYYVSNLINAINLKHVMLLRKVVSTFHITITSPLIFTSLALDKVCYYHSTGKMSYKPVSCLLHTLWVRVLLKALPCSRTANHAWQIRLQECGHMIALECIISQMTWDTCTCARTPGHGGAVYLTRPFLTVCIEGSGHETTEWQCKLRRVMSLSKAIHISYVVTWTLTS